MTHTDTTGVDSGCGTKNLQKRKEKIEEEKIEDDHDLVSTSKQEKMTLSASHRITATAAVCRHHHPHAVHQLHRRKKKNTSILIQQLRVGESGG